MRLRPHDAKIRRRVLLPDGRLATVLYVPPRTGQRVKVHPDTGGYASYAMDELQPAPEPAEEAS